MLDNFAVMYIENILYDGYGKDTYRYGYFLNKLLGAK